MLRSKPDETRIPFWISANIRLSSWLLPLWAYNRDLHSLFAYFDIKPNEKYRAMLPHIYVEIIQQITRKPWFLRDRRCLRIGLLTMKFLKLAGHNPILHFGIELNSMDKISLTAHCWVENDGQVIANDILENMVQVYSIRADMKEMT